MKMRKVSSRSSSLLSRGVYRAFLAYSSQAEVGPTYRPVHEASHTYSAGSRESLINPIIPKASGTPSPYLSQQPRYVYVQAGSHQVQPNGVVTYGQPQHHPENLPQQQSHQDITYASVDQNQYVDASQQTVHAPAPRPQYGPPAYNYVQYLPVLPQSP